MLVLNEVSGTLQVDWVRDGEMVQVGGPLNITTITSEAEAVSTIHFSPVTASDGGHYTCTATLHSQDLEDPAIAIVSQDIIVQCKCLIQTTHKAYTNKDVYYLYSGNSKYSNIFLTYWNFAYWN